MRDLEKEAKKALSLARLEPGPDLIEHVKRVLELMESFSGLDLSGVEPMISPLNEKTPLREDVPDKPLSRSRALSDAPDTQAGFFRTPRP